MNNIHAYYDQFKAFIFGVLLYLHIDKDVALILIYLIFADMVAGGIKSVYIKDLSFSFKSFWAGLVRKSLMLLLIMVLALIARGLGFQDFKLMVNIVIKAMILTEGISVINNIRSVFDKKNHVSNDFISIIIGKVSNYLQKYMEKLMKFFDQNSTCL